VFSYYLNTFFAEIHVTFGTPETLMRLVFCKEEMQGDASWSVICVHASYKAS